MKKWLATFLTNGQGQADTMLTLSVLGVLSYIAFEGYALIWMHQAFHAFDYATGMGATIAAAASGMGLRTRLSVSQTGISTGGATNAGSSN